MTISITTLLKCRLEDLRRLAAFLEIEGAETMEQKELAVELFNTVNEPLAIASGWMKPGSWRDQ